ncbi:hypothetical protein FJY90_02430 [Candidatus Gottesmanbacteria bacterium]|nr:hypothetical protein [Candidatus Gottesmanbacteria bacterium]
MANAIIFGNLTIDDNFLQDKKFTSPGGSAYFCAKTFENLGINPTIIARYGEDFPKKYLLKTIYYPTKATDKKTLYFKNFYSHGGDRYQWVKNQQMAKFISIEKIPQNLLKNKDIVIVAPLIDSLSCKELIKICNYYKNSLVILLPQGFYRKILSGGRIRQRNWSQAEKIIPLFDFIILSNKDYFQAEELAEAWNKKGPIVIVTKSGQGCTIFNKGQKYTVEAARITKIVSRSGVGDIFAAAFAYAFNKNGNVVDSGRFANTVSAYSLRFMPNQLQYSYQDFVNFIRYPKY